MCSTFLPLHMKTHQAITPNVSVVIPCYNQARFLPQAIQSVEKQTYPNVEIVVVNDGSTDDTSKVAALFEKVVLVNQVNQGLAAARNTGINHARGEYLIFLDADDVLLPDAIRRQVAIMDENKTLGFVTGGHITADESLNSRHTVTSSINERHYENLLVRNYVGMHAAVMYRAAVLQQLKFDATLHACEDYDLMLRIAAKYPVFSHAHPIAIYRGHSGNMSDNLTMMLEQALHVLQKQKENLQTRAQKSAYQKGIRNWVDFYCYRIYTQITNLPPHSKKLETKLLQTLWQYKRRLYIRFYLHKIKLLLNAS